MAINIPGYSALPPKKRQVVHLVAAATVVLGFVMLVSGFVGGPTTIKATANTDLPKPRALNSVPGAALDSKDAWVGGAGKDLARVRDDLKLQGDELKHQADELRSQRASFEQELKQLRDGRGVATSAPVAPPPSSSSPAAGTAGTTGRADAPSLRPAAPTTAGMPPAMSPSVFPTQPRADRSASTGSPTQFPPGAPNGAQQTNPASPVAADVPPPPMLMRVSLGAKPESGDGAPARGGPQAGPSPRRVDNFLPVSFTSAYLLGGLAAPTGGQAQANPVPVLLRLADYAVLPNEFRSKVKNCLVVGEGFGDRSAERAYIRLTLLSCVLRDGTVLEVKVKGSVFGEDGMNGVNGHLVSKQGQILTNALISGIAAGIGGGIAQSAQVIQSSPLGTTTTTGTDTSSILKAGFGTGVGKALDRLSQYYISLAESTFPVIEVQPGRKVDVVLTEGVHLDVALAASRPADNVRAGDRSALLRSVQDDEDD